MRSCRLMLSDLLRLDQRKIVKRLALALPIFAAVIILTNVDFSIVWRYFGWANQGLSCITLWSIAVCLRRRGRFYWLALLPALFMTTMCAAFLLSAHECAIEMDLCYASAIGAAFTVILTGGFFALCRRA